MLPQRIDIAQRTPEWHEWRSRLGMASEAAAMLGISPHYPRTPNQLALVKSGAASIYVSAAMRQGTALEDEALRATERRAWELFAPACYQRGNLGASLDGITLTGDVIAEVKVPAKGSQSETYQAALAKQVPDHHMAQIQQQLWCSGADTAIYGVYAHDTGEAAIVEVSVIPELRDQIITGWADYFDRVARGALGRPERDERTDIEWLAAAAAYRVAKEQSDIHAAILDDARARLEALADGRSSTGGGLRYTVSERKGSIDYRAALSELAPGADLEGWRKAASSTARITLEDEE